MHNNLFTLTGVGYSYYGKFPALRSIDMSILSGEKIAVIGANGSGKSTLLQMLDGLIFPDSGRINIFGKDLSEAVFSDPEFSRNFRKRVGFVFQNPEVQLFCPTVEEDIIFGPLQLGVEKEEVRKRTVELAESFKIGDLLQRSPHQLSIGEKRKVAIASCLAIDPEVLILDEPTAGLDPQTSRHIVEIIIEANQSGKTIITATHDLHIVEEIADTIYVFSNQKTIAKSGPVKEILEDREFLESHNLIHVHAHRHLDKVHIHPHQHLEHHP